MTNEMAMLDPSKAISKADYERRLKSFGLDKPWYEAYFVWLGNVVLKGDLGRSIALKKPVARLIGERAGPTLLLSAMSLGLTYLLAIPMGLWFTVRSGKPDERIISTSLYTLYSLPSFVAALYLQILLAVKLGWLPLMGLKSNDFDELSVFGKTLDILSYAAMPIICFTYGSLAYYSRFIKSNMGEVIRQDYIRTARAKGVPPVRIIVHHAFRNTLIPLVTLIGLTLPGLLGGAVILEQIFNWPGMGQLFFAAIGQRDLRDHHGADPDVLDLDVVRSIVGRRTVRVCRSARIVLVVLIATRFKCGIACERRNQTTR